MRLLRDGKVADDVSSNSFSAVDGRRKGWRRIIPRNYLSKYIVPEEPFPIQIRSNGNRIYRSYPSLRSGFFAESEDRRAAVTPFKNVYTSGARRCGSETEIDGGRSVRLRSRVVRSNFKYVQIAEDFIIDTDSCEYTSAAGHIEVGLVASERLAAYCRIVYADFNRKSYFPIGFYGYGPNERSNRTVSR